MTLTSERIRTYGEELYRAVCDRTTVAPLTEREPAIDVEDAYRIQLASIGQRLRERNETVIGWKIGVTSKAVMTMLSVNQPDFGHLTSAMLYENGATIPLDTLIQPRAEGEIAFVLRRKLVGPGVSPVDVLAATECVMPCFEIVDSRIRDWKIRIQDTVADNASSGVFVLGDRAVSPHGVDLRLCGMVFERNGDVVGLGAGAATLGSPLLAMAWLANTLSALGIELEPGQVILSGSLGPLVPIGAGDDMRVSIGGIGSAAMRFVATRDRSEVGS
jgi:2-oxopent-4-enoate/cis-2-oxohex-4-enoate hydratase